MSVQSMPGILESGDGDKMARTLVYLCGHISNRGFHDSPHTMDVCISRLCGLWFLVNGAGRCEDMLECLWKFIISAYTVVIDSSQIYLQRSEVHCVEGCSMGPWHCMYNWHIEILAIDHQLPGFAHSWASSWFYCGEWFSLLVYMFWVRLTWHWSNQGQLDTAVLRCTHGWSLIQT